MKHALLEHIVCPSDKHPLALEVQKADNSEIINGTLTCKNGHTYSIERGVPRLLSSSVLKLQAHASAVQKTKESFSNKGSRIPNFGLREGQPRILREPVPGAIRISILGWSTVIPER